MAALAQLIDAADLGLLSDRALSGGDDAETKAAREALKVAALRATDPDAAAAKLAGLITGATADNRAYLMDLIRRVGGAKALEIVVAAARSDDADTKDLGTQVLGQWLSPNAAPALLQIAQSEADERYQVRAVRGYIRIARQLEMSDKERLAMFDTALATAKRPADKEIALDILTRMTPAGQGRALKAALGQLGHADLEKAAASTAVKVARGMVAKNPRRRFPPCKRCCRPTSRGPSPRKPSGCWSKPNRPARPRNSQEQGCEIAGGCAGPSLPPGKGRGEGDCLQVRQHGLQARQRRPGDLRSAKWLGRRPATTEVGRPATTGVGVCPLR